MFVVGGESLIDLVQEPLGPGWHGADDRASGRLALQLRHRAVASWATTPGYLCPISEDGVRHLPARATCTRRA